jgi:hypothetical protein
MAGGSTFHSLPTHLGVRDPVLWGLNDVQLTKVGVGALVAGFVMRQSALPFWLRVGLGALVMLAAIACALVRVQSQPLEEWLLAAGRYLARPRALVWRSRRRTHAWSRTGRESLPGGGGRGIGRYCLRNIRVRWTTSAQPPRFEL